MNPTLDDEFYDDSAPDTEPLRDTLIDLEPYGAWNAAFEFAAEDTLTSLEPLQLDSL